MDRESAQAYVNRWKAVEAVERMEAQTESIELRWKRFLSLVALAKALGLLPLENREEEEVRERWRQLRAQYNDSTR